MIGVHKRTSTSKTKKHKKGKKIESFLDLNIGDYVVHENSGVGRYTGIEQISVNKIITFWKPLEILNLYFNILFIYS